MDRTRSPNASLSVTHGGTQRPPGQTAAAGALGLPEVTEPTPDVL